MQHVALSTLLQYENKWVALSPDQKTIIESDETVEKVEKKLRQKKIKEAVITFIPSADKSLSP